MKHIGKGSYGDVVLARNKETGESNALKFIERGPGLTQNVEKEIINHRKCFKHPCVIKLNSVFLTKAHLVLVLEYAAGGTLREFISNAGKLSEADARRLFQELIFAVEYCHSLGIASRDIKPENCLLDGVEGNLPGHLKLADFGYSKDETQSIANTRLGTPEYTAPEIFNLERGDSYDPKVNCLWMVVSSF